MENKKEEFLISTYIKRYPFNGRSEYLIDKFYIMGYNFLTLNKLLFEDNNDKENLSKNIILDKIDEDKKSSSLNLQPFHLSQEPSILSEISSDYDKKCLNYDIMKDMISPNKLLLYYSEEDTKEYRAKEKEKEKEKEDNDNIADNFCIYEKYDNFNNDLLKSYCVIFSSNPQTENNSKKSINGLAYIFYKKLIKKKITPKKVYTFYIPTVFSIVSEYPFFSSFYKLCKQIKTLFSLSNNDIPIEFMIYNIIKFTESPINSEIILSIKPFIYPINEDIIEEEKMNIINEEINEDEEPINKKPEESDLSNRPSKIISKKISKKNTEILANEKSIDLTKYDTEKPNRHKSTKVIIKSKKRKFNKNSQNGEEGNINLDELFPKIRFETLPGYPLIQYNLAKVLLDIMSPLHIIEIFLYTFLEKNVIFFSKNLQYLSATINSYLNLNFPLNDEKYYFINATVSLDNYVNNNSPFIGSAFTTIIGINSSYNVKYLQSPNKIKEHLVVNLDKDEVYKIEDKKQKENSKKNKDLFNYIKKICKKEVKNEKKQTILSREIYNLYKELNDINNLLHNAESDIDNSDAYKLFKNGDYLDYDDSINNYIKKTNIQIQNSFYRLINNLCLYFYQNLSLRTEDDDIKKYSKNIKKKIDKTEMNVIFREDYKEDDEKSYINEEIFFLDELRETMKYESFVYCFVQSYSPIDLYKIPLTFTEEFLSIITRKSSILENDINFFGIINRLYKMKDSSIKEIDFLPFFTKYNKDYKKDFEREIEEMNEENVFNEELITVKYCNDKSKKNKYLKYRDYELNNNLLMKYLNMINNLKKDEFEIIFFMSPYINKNHPKEILVIDIENIIETYSIETHLLSQSDLCCSNIILLFSLSLKFLDNSIDCNSFLGLLFKSFTVFRKYYSYITYMLYALFSNYMNNHDYARAHFYLILYFICVNSMRALKLVPNESLMKVMKKFNDLDLKKFNDKIENQNKSEKVTTWETVTEQKNKEEIKFTREELNNENLYTIYNFDKYKIYNEEEIIKLLASNSEIIENGKKIAPKIRYQNKILRIETLFDSQLNIISNLVKVYNKYIIDLNEENIDYKVLMDCCINILVYMRNLRTFKNLEEITDVVEVIFFLILNKYDKIKNNSLIE